MQGALTLHAGVLFVGRQNLTAEIVSYDLGGRPLETKFEFRDEDVGRSSVSGIDVDADRRIWVADSAARRVRCFTLFGKEVASVSDDMVPGPAAKDDRHGLIGAPVDLRVAGEDDDMVLVVASGGVRRHGLQILHLATGQGRSVAPLGDPEAKFQRIRGLDWWGDEVAVCEAGARRVQVFEGEVTGRLVFRFAFDVPPELGDPEAVALVGDGRILVATAGEFSGVHLFDAGGRPLACIASDAQKESSFGDAQVDQPSALALQRADSDRHTRLCVLDQQGERVQVLSLDGRSFGAVLSAQ